MGYKLGYRVRADIGIAHPIAVLAPDKEVNSIPRPFGGEWPAATAPLLRLLWIEGLVGMRSLGQDGIPSVRQREGLT